MTTPHESWQKNIKSKFDTIKSLGTAYVAQKEDRLSEGKEKETFEGIQNELESQIQSLQLMYGQGHTPKEVRDLSGYFNALKKNLRSAEHLFGFLIAIKNLPNALLNIEEKVSFDDIFEAYKSDEELGKLIEKLISTLQKILDEGDEYLSAQICRSLDEIIKELKNRSSHSMNEINVWVDWTVKVCLTIAETQIGFPGLNLAYEAIKHARETQRKLMECHEKAQITMAKEKKMKLAEKVILELPQDISDEELTKKLESNKK